MKLTVLQWVSFISAGAMLGAALLDIAGVIEPPDLVWIIVPLALFAFNLVVGPSFREINAAHRRASRKSAR